MPEYKSAITVGELRMHLKEFPDDYALIFKGDLAFYRVKQRGPELVQIEFSNFVRTSSEADEPFIVVPDKDPV